MLTVSYSLTREDLAELEAEARGGFFLRLLRMLAAVFLGVFGLVLVWQALFFFPKNNRFATLLVAGAGVLSFWAALDWSGLRGLFRRLSDSTAEQQLSILEGKIVYACRGKTRQYRWLPERGFKEGEKFFFLRTFRSRVKFAIPKRAFSHAQVSTLRELLEAKPASEDAVDCRFFLTQSELDEALLARHPRTGTKLYRRLARVLCAAGAAWLLWLPSHLGTSWSKELRDEPGIAAALAVFAAFNLWTAMGCPGIRASRLGLERHIRVSNFDVKVTLGEKTSIYKWERFGWYQETQHLMILWTPYLLFWTIPKRALSVGDQERLRSLLISKLPDSI